MNLGTLTQFERSENYDPILNESSLKGAEKSQSNGWEWSKAFASSFIFIEEISFSPKFGERKKANYPLC